jgi:hypothetical protein
MIKKFDDSEIYNQLNISDLENGFYFLRIEKTDKTTFVVEFQIVK